MTFDCKTHNLDFPLDKLNLTSKMCTLVLSNLLCLPKPTKCFAI